jgi:hypothetical protein
MAAIIIYDPSRMSALDGASKNGKSRQRQVQWGGSPPPGKGWLLGLLEAAGHAPANLLDNKAAVAVEMRIP